MKVDVMLNLVLRKRIPHYAIVQHETFAPILYVMKYTNIRGSHCYSKWSASGIVFCNYDIEYERV